MKEKIPFLLYKISKILVITIDKMVIIKVVIIIIVIIKYVQF